MNRRGFFKGLVASAFLPSFLKAIPVMPTPIEAAADFRFSGFYSMIPLGQIAPGGTLSSIIITNAGEGYTEWPS